MMAMIKLKIKARKLYPYLKMGLRALIFGYGPPLHNVERYGGCLNVRDGEWCGYQMIVGWCEYFEKSGFSTYSLI